MNRVTDKYYGSAHSTANMPDVVYYYDNALNDASSAYSWGKLRQVNVVGYGTGVQGTGKSNGHGYLYDFKGRAVEDVVTTTNTYTSRPYITSYSYDTGDRLVSMTYPNPGTPEVVTTTYNTQGMGLPSSLTSNVSGNPNPVYDTQYNEWGELTSLRQGSAVQSSLLTTQFAYNVRGWLTNTLASTLDSNSQPVTQLNMSYGYDANGNVTTLSNTSVSSPNSTSNPTFSNAYSYDWLDRLASGSSTAVGIGGASLFPIENYSYDNLDRMTTRSIGTNSYSYAYTDPSHVDAPTSYRGNGYTYDANGDQLTGTVNGNSQTRTYDQERRLVQITSASTTLTFIYDGNDQRIIQNVTQNLATTSTLYIGSFYEETLTGGSNPPYIVYYTLGSKMVGMRRANQPGVNTNGQFRVVGDQLGSTTLLIDTAPVPNVTQREYYKPYGEVAFSSGSSRTDKGFTGQRLDASSGLMYYGARYYDPVLSYFISPDSIVPGSAVSSGGGADTLGVDDRSKLISLTTDFHETALLGEAQKENVQVTEKGFWFQLSRDDKQKARDPWGPKNPQALNRYGYAMNNPVRYFDPTGHIIRYTYDWLIGNTNDVLNSSINPAGTTNLSARSAMDYMKSHISEVFPWRVRFDKGGGSSLHVGDKFTLLNAGPPIPFVQQDQTLEVIAMDDTSFTLRVVSGFEPVGSVITFSTYERDGNVYLRQNATTSEDRLWDFIGAGIAKSAWQTQADVLHDAFYGNKNHPTPSEGPTPR